MLFFFLNSASGFIAPLLREREPRRLFNIISRSQYIIPQQILVYLQTRLKYTERERERKSSGRVRGRGRGIRSHAHPPTVAMRERERARKNERGRILSGVWFSSGCQSNSMTDTRWWPVSTPASPVPHLVQSLDSRASFLLCHSFRRRLESLPDF